MRKAGDRRFRPLRHLALALVAIAGAMAALSVAGLVRSGDLPPEGKYDRIVIDIGKALERLNRETGLTIILVEQNLGLIKAISHRGYVLDKGKTTAILSIKHIADRDVMLRHLSV